MSPIKLMDFHEILDELECVSCGKPHNRVVYYRPDTYYWELAEDTLPHVNSHYKTLREFDDRRSEGLHLQTVVIENGFCRECIVLKGEVRFRGVHGWYCVQRTNSGKTKRIPHSSEYRRDHRRNRQDKCGLPEQPEWD